MFPSDTPISCATSLKKAYKVNIETKLISETSLLLILNADTGFLPINTPVLLLY
jgi:hypothetical protein